MDILGFGYAAVVATGGVIGYVKAGAYRIPVWDGYRIILSINDQKQEVSLYKPIGFYLLLVSGF